MIRKVFTPLGASNHVAHDRPEHDYYATEPAATKWLLKLEELNHHIWEPASGEGHMADVLQEAGHDVRRSDIVQRTADTEQLDFLRYNGNWPGDIVTNPPYKLAQEFIEKSMEVMAEGSTLALFLRVLFLEGQRRREMFKKYPPVRVWVSSARLKCAKNGDFDAIGSSATAYAWFVWEKGYKGDTIIKWFN